MNKLNAKRWKNIYQADTNQKKIRDTILKSMWISQQKLWGQE